MLLKLSQKKEEKNKHFTNIENLSGGKDVVKKVIGFRTFTNECNRIKNNKIQFILENTLLASQNRIASTLLFVH